MPIYNDLFISTGASQVIVSVPKTGETGGVERSTSAYTYYCAEEPTSVEPEVGTALIVEPEAMHVLFLRNETLWLRARQKNKSFFHKDMTSDMP